jgi:hypothetical protein
MIKNILTLISLLSIVIILSVAITKVVITTEINTCLNAGKDINICEEELYSKYGRK